uniref:DUF1565 domain-containing protein n=1 Tax=Amphimedon queenslandica TaxID=400682 RepID=A0A1X7V710_AMPQE
MMNVQLMLYTVLLIITFQFVKAKEYYVSVNDGSNDNPGTLQKPWKSINKAVKFLKSGDTCIIRGGTYTEAVVINGLKGKVYAPIVFKSYPGERVIFDGTTSIKGHWEIYRNDIYSLKLDFDIWQLFVDGEMQINARWPNAFWYDKSVFDYKKWGFSSKESTFNLEKSTGVMIDNGTHLAKSGINATGAIAILNIGQWLTWAGIVTNHTIGNASFAYYVPSKPKAVHFIAQNCRYFLEDKLEFLDSPTEWYFDPVEKRVYVWLSDINKNPSDHDIRGKVSTYAFFINNGSAHITLSGLNFFATTVHVRAQSKSEDVNNIKLESCYFSYPSYSHRALGSTAVPNTTTIYYNGDLVQNSGNFSVFNCTFEYADGQTMSYRGADGVFENNIWRYNDFTCVGDGFLLRSEGVRDVFVRNTVHSNGPCEGYAPGNGDTFDRKLGLAIGSEVRLNLFYDLKYLQGDGSHVQTNIYAQNGSVLEYNWCYDTRKWGLRFDRADVDGALWGYNGTMRHNVVWTTRGIRLKGDNHHCYNNLAFDNELYFDLCLYGFPGDGAKGENSHTVTKGNILQNGACSSIKTSECQYDLPGQYINNVKGDVRHLLRDPDNFDFRPIIDSDLVLKGVGPYGKESMAHGGVYWIPGHQDTASSMPIPPNGTNTAKCNCHLMWLSGYNADKHDVYFGLSESSVQSATTSSPEYKVTMTSPANIFDPGSLKSAVPYYWRVDSVKELVTTKGSVWNFKCQ